MGTLHAQSKSPRSGSTACSGSGYMLPGSRWHALKHNSHHTKFEIYHIHSVQENLNFTSLGHAQCNTNLGGHICLRESKTLNVIILQIHLFCPKYKAAVKACIWILHDLKSSLFFSSFSTYQHVIAEIRVVPTNL